ncbi:MAG: BlaI/MecI/CopY family transcriptional regulator [Candidatus Eisenbacteria bacterium]|jgi:predicted transcriptional regulator|nr:BlaI/MecI/CopY family transcriptional regulator [Candidatus Eisenbacteria bacterium]
MKRSLPDLSRFEVHCLRRLWVRGDATARDILDDLPDPPTYSTVRKILERLEDKGAVARVRMDGKAVVYRSLVTPSAMIRKEIGRLLDTLFDGSAVPLVAHLADMRAVTLGDLRDMEARLSENPGEVPSDQHPAPGDAAPIGGAS